MPRDTSASAEFVACRKKAFACVSLAGELLIFTPKLIPERVEGLVVGPMDDMTEPVEGSQRSEYIILGNAQVRILMEHRIDNLLQG